MLASGGIVQYPGSLLLSICWKAQSHGGNSRAWIWAPFKALRILWEMRKISCEHPWAACICCNLIFGLPCRKYGAETNTVHVVKRLFNAYTPHAGLCTSNVQRKRHAVWGWSQSLYPPARTTQLCTRWIALLASLDTDYMFNAWKHLPDFSFTMREL